jgi:nucleotide-binding universal stress UspA family protein
MIALRQILCPTDFSKYSDHALDYGVELAKQFGGTLHVQHVIQLAYMTVAYEIAPDIAASREIAERNAREKMDAKIKELESRGVKAEPHITIGTPFVDIITLARDQSVDLIIIATHGWGAFKQLLLGSTAERVVRKAPCPVLTIKHPEHEFVLP